MDWLPAVVAAACGLAYGWLAPGFQHYLYRDPEHRARPASGRRLLALRMFLAGSSALALFFAFRPGHYDAGPALATAAFALVLLTLSSTDFERRLIPNRLVYPALAAAAALACAWPDRDAGDVVLGAAVALGAGATLFGLGLLPGGRGALGLGDVKLMVLVGLLSGWPLVVTALFLGVLFAGVPALVLTFAGRGRQYFSYGPYLAAGALVALLFPGWFR